MNPANLATIIRSRADAPFLIDSVQGITHTYGGFHRGACELADRLKLGGIRRGDRVAIFAHNSAEFVAAYFACLYLGATAVPVNPQIHDNEVRFILDRCGLHALLYSAKTRARVQPDIDRARFSLCLGPSGEAGLESWSLCENIPARDTDWQYFELMTADQIFSITFTSGTTGLPKGVVHTAGNLLGSAQAFNNAFGFGEDMRMLHVFNMAYMAGFLNTLLCPFLAGGSVVIGPAFDVSMAMRFWEVPIKHGVNTLWLVPTILKILLKMDRGDRGRTYCRQHIKTICAGTAQLQSQVKAQFEAAYGVAVHESYGLSELLFLTSNSPTIPFKQGSAGRALEGVQVRIASGTENGEPASQTGEVLIKTPCCMAGYLNYETGLPDPAPEWFPTGDVGRVSEDGYLFITDRKKDLIIRGGLNISPRSVELVIERHPQVEQTAVVGLPHEYYGEEVVAAIRLKDGARLADILPSVRTLCTDNLSEVSRPTAFFEVAEFPLGTTGKLHKGKLRAKLQTLRQPQ